MLCMNEALENMRIRGITVLPEDVKCLSPLGYDYSNLLGRYTFLLPEEIRQGALRPLRQVEDEDTQETAQANESIMKANIQKEA